MSAERPFSGVGLNVLRSPFRGASTKVLKGIPRRVAEINHPAIDHAPYFAGEPRRIGRKPGPLPRIGMDRPEQVVHPAAVTGEKPKTMRR